MAELVSSSDVVDLVYEVAQDQMGRSKPFLENLSNVKSNHFESFQDLGPFRRNTAANFECDWFNGELRGWSGARVMKFFLFTRFFSLLRL